MCRRGADEVLLFVYGDDELVHAPLALVNPAIVEHQGHPPPGVEAALPSRPPQVLAAARGPSTRRPWPRAPAADPSGSCPRGRAAGSLLLILVPGGRAAGSLLL